MSSGNRKFNQLKGMSRNRAITPSLIALVVSGLCSAGVQARTFDTANPDLEIHWDNTIRYNLGIRGESRESGFDRSSFFDDTEHKFDRGDVVTNRLDVLSEFDVVWRGQHGVRMSLAGWYDDAYQGRAEPNPDLGRSGNFINNRFNSYTDRYIAGPSGEILDAFVFTGFDIWGMGVSLKAGQHNVYWGESLYSIGNSIAYSQGPVDTIKSATSPGAEAKELFLPMKQVSVGVQLTNELSLAGQYLLDWKPFRLVPGGTYFGPSDGSRSDLGNTAAAGLAIPNRADYGPSDDKGDFGLSLRWSPSWLQGTVGFYYRKFDEKLPWSFTELGLSGLPRPFPPVLPTAIRLAYARDTKLYGLSLSQTVGTISVAGEVSYRKDTALNSVAGYQVLPATFGSATYAEVEGARGDSWHALVNGIYLLPRNALWEGGTLQAELSWNRLDKITENPRRFNGGSYGCVTAYRENCATKTSLGFQVGFTPEWPQLFAGWDVSMPVTFAYGINGNSPTPGGTNEDAYSYSLGVTGKLKNAHIFTVRWVDTRADYGIDPVTGYVTSAYTNGSAVQNNHGWLSLSYRTSF